MSDPLAMDPQDTLAMTHQPVQPDPGQRYLDMIRRGAAAAGAFAQGGVTGVMQQQGVQTPEWSNKIGNVLQSEAANTAFGMASPLKGTKDWLGAIKAYHASPHDFDRVDLSKIGTGQGAQSYGHGFYAAENPAVSGRGGQYDKEFSAKLREGLPPSEKYAGNALASATGDRQKAIKSLETDRSYYDQSVWESGHPKAMTDAIELLKSDWEPPRAKIYEVAINADPQHFLDWDKPLSEQSNIENKVLPLLSDSERERYDNLKKYAAASMPSVGESTMNMLERSLGKEKTSDALRQAGIPGIKYFDQGSRNVDRLPQMESDLNQLRASIAKVESQTGNTRDVRLENLRADEQRLAKEVDYARNPTRNYVVFDDKMIDILKKYGLTGLLGGGLGASQLQDPDPLKR